MTAIELPPIFDEFDADCLHAQTHIPDTARVGYCVRCERPYADDLDLFVRDTAFDEDDPFASPAMPDADEAPELTGEAL